MKMIEIDPGYVGVVTARSGKPARDTLAGFKCPKRVILRDAMPRNAMGKVLKSELRADYAKLFA